MIRAGRPHKQRFQGLEIRAPEIWKRAFSSPACDVWSLGVSVSETDFMDLHTGDHAKSLLIWTLTDCFLQLTHYLMGKCIFGATDLNIQIASKSHEVTQAAWSIGKIIKLIGPFTRDEDSAFSLFGIFLL